MQKRVRAMCDRDRDGTLIRKVFHVPAGIPWIEEQDVVLEFIDIACAITEMLQDSSIASEENWIWESESFKGVYGELNTGAWWRDVERRCRAKKNGVCICPVMLYADKAHPDWRKGAGFKPVLVICGNYIGSVNRSMKGKRIINYWPHIEVCIFIVLPGFQMSSDLLALLVCLLIACALS